MSQQHAQAGDYVKKNGGWIKVDQISASGETYYTSDGGCIGFSEVGPDDVKLPSEIE